MKQVPSHITDVDRFDYKYPIKRLFVSRFKNGKLFNIDYSNLEMRVMGLVTKEESMTNAFLSGHDIHKDNAKAITDLVKKVTPKLSKANVALIAINQVRANQNMRSPYDKKWIRPGAVCI